VDPQSLDQLPKVYSLALRLQAAGVDDCLLADCLGLEIEAVGPLLRIATAKLANLNKSGESETGRP
jgi:hypothetical protein